MSSLEEDWIRYAKAIRECGSDALVLTNYEYKKLVGALPGPKARDVIESQSFLGLPIVIEE